MKYLEKFNEDSRQLWKDILFKFSKTYRNSGKNEKSLTKFYKHTSTFAVRYQSSFVTPVLPADVVQYYHLQILRNKIQ